MKVIVTQIAMVMLMLSTVVMAQTSSLYMQPVQPPAPMPTTPGVPGAELPGVPLSSAVAQVSLIAVRVPEPRRFAMHDLVTIIVRENTSADASSTLDTGKDSQFNGEISNWPGIRVFDLLADQVLAQGPNDKPKLGVKFKNEFKGEGDYSRRDSFTTRVTARIIDIKPNGTLVLEARKFIQSDKESMELVLTGVCRREDVHVDNTVQSTQLYDLRLVKNHQGELFRATDKGVLTKMFEFLFNF